MKDGVIVTKATTISPGYIVRGIVEGGWATPMGPGFDTFEG
jgi:hypothetical protein